MYTYFSTFTTGFEKVIPEILKSKIKDAVNIRTENGLILFDTLAEWQEIKKLPMFSNSFYLIRQFDNSNIEDMYSWTKDSPRFSRSISNFIQDHRTSIRIMASKANQTVAIPENQLNEIEHILLQNPNIVIDRRNPRFEVWFMERSDGTGLIGLRVTTHQEVKSNLQKGELHPDLVYILNYLSEPSSKDIFLDPFCGSGAISIQRATNFPYSRIIASDTDTSKINKRLSTQKHRLHDFEIISADTRQLTVIKDNSIDKIVTDPPWGMYKEVEKIENFYGEIMNEFARALKPQGIIILLTAQKELITETNSLSIIDTWDILVSGKKARVYKTKKAKNIKRGSLRNGVIAQ